MKGGSITTYFSIPGDPKATEAILVNGHPFEATSNLVIFFRQFGQLYEDKPDLHPLPPWVDAVCINQSNILERNGQARQMGAIYRHATRVIPLVKPRARRVCFSMRGCKNMCDRHIELRNSSLVAGRTRGIPLQRKEESW